MGVRTGTTGDRRIAKNFSCTTKNGLFMDLSDSYYVSYGTDEGGDACQRHATKDFTLTVNGASEKHRSGTSVVATAPNAPSGKRFWRWDANKSTGLSPVTDYITSKTKYNQSLAFAMPQNDVSLTASYADTVKSGKITVAAPEAGKSLPAMAILTRTDGGSGGSAALVYVSWYEVADNGTAVAAAAHLRGPFCAFGRCGAAALQALRYTSFHMRRRRQRTALRKPTERVPWLKEPGVPAVRFPLSASR